MAEPVSVTFKHGIPGLLVTSGIALLAISVVLSALFRPGATLLLLGILSFIIREGAEIVDSLAEQNQKHGLESSDIAVGVVWLLSLIGLAVIVVLIFVPLLGL